MGYKDYTEKVPNLQIVEHVFITFLFVSYLLFTDQSTIPPLALFSYILYSNIILLTV